jgi:uroporphyrinogen-III synthase
LTACLILRPPPGASATARRVEAAGGEAIVAPLFSYRPLPWALPDALPATVLLTSAAAPRLAGHALLALTGRPCYVVGEATEAAARSAGFGHVVTAGPDLVATLDRMAADGVGEVLHLAGRDHRDAGHPAIQVVRRIVYAFEAATALPGAARDALGRHDVTVLLHSPRAARCFAGLVDAGQLARATISLAAFSPAVADAAGGGWATMTIAATPTDAALLAAIGLPCDKVVGREDSK